MSHNTAPLGLDNLLSNAHPSVCRRPPGGGGLECKHKLHMLITNSKEHLCVAQLSTKGSDRMKSITQPKYEDFVIKSEVKSGSPVQFQALCRLSAKGIDYVVLLSIVTLMCLPSQSAEYNSFCCPYLANICIDYSHDATASTQCMHFMPLQMKQS